MPSELISAQQSSLDHAPSRTTLLLKFAPVFYYVFLAVTVLAVFIPLNPRMPGTGIDQSWQFAMNQAVARHLRFGPEVMFTYGPYAAIATRMYDPATDHRMMWGSTLLAVSYIAAVLFLAGPGKRFQVVLLLLFLATFGPGELLFLSYPLLLLLCVLKQASLEDLHQGAMLNRYQVAAVLIMWATLGLLPLVKVSFLVPFAAGVVIPPAFLLYRRRFRSAILLFFVPIAASMTLWIAAGQSLKDIPTFLRGTLLLTSGYTDAMATAWSVLPRIVGDGLVFVSLITSALISLSVIRSTHLTFASKWALGALSSLFLLVAFKHGFVIVMNVSGAFAALAVCALTIALLYVDKSLIVSFCIAALLTATTSVIRDPVLIKEVHQKFGVGVAWTGGQARGDILAFCLQRAMDGYARTTYMNTWHTYVAALDGLYSRVFRSNDLKSRFAAAAGSIRNDHPLPVLQGTADIYDYDQSVLLASGNVWNPRPVVQSYSAYLPELATLNEQHLRRSDAPDWVIFALETIDERLPSLDDGLSWPAFLDNYAFVAYDGRFVQMHKRQSIRLRSRYQEVSTGTYRAGETINLPQTDGLLFAEVDFKPTLEGKLMTELFAPPQLHIVVRMANGKVRTFRTIANMMKTEILLSPLVSDTGDFASMMSGTKQSLSEKAVQAVSIAPSYGGSLFWSGTYTLTLKKFVEQ